MKLNIFILILSVTLSLPYGTYSQTVKNANTIRLATEQLIQSKACHNAICGICAIDSDGDTLASHNAHTRMVPASNMKLLSTGTALLTLGPQYRYLTRLGYSGEIKDGILEGDLYIIGGGDPTLCTKDRFSPTTEQIFQKWHELIKKAGIRKINGRIIGDGSYFTEMREHASWSWSDIGTYYGTGISGLNFFENILAFNVSHGDRTGSPVYVEQTYPKTPWMDFRFNCSTGEEQTGDQLYLYTTDMSAKAELRGTFAIDRNTKTIECSNKFPEYTCAYYFYKWLDSRGVRCVKGPSDTGHVKETNPENAQAGKNLSFLGETGSPTMEKIVTSTNFESNNLFAEVIFKTLGKEFGRNDSYKEAAKVMKEALKDLGIPNAGELHISDGSGLSRENLVSPAYLASFLAAMEKSPAFKAFLNSLPAPESEGTMYYFMKGYDKALQSRIRLKSGSMTGIKCYSGYILPSAEGKPTITFSIMANNFTAPQREVQKEIEKVIAALAGSN